MDFDPKRHRLKMVDALRYIGGLSHNTPTRSMLRHLEKCGLIDRSTLVGASEFSLTRGGEVLKNQAEAYFLTRSIPSQSSVQRCGKPFNENERGGRQLGTRVWATSC